MDPILAEAFDQSEVLQREVFLFEIICTVNE